MNTIFYNTLIFICALFFGGVAIVFSIRPDNTQMVNVVQSNEKAWSKLTLTPEKEGNTYKVSSEIIDITTTKVSQNTPMLVDFGRLSSFLYLAPLGSQEEVLTQSGTSGIILGKASGIISLYDLFMSYTIYDVDNSFRLEQITNGSFYIGKEKDGKIAIYAIDGVVRLTFVHQNEDMTNMILFPGSYLRFDPTRNRSLKNADLFRTILSLKDTDNEVFEFVNPRVNIGDAQDAFFNYRLPVSSIVLFRALSSRFKEKVDMRTIREKYGYYTYDFTEKSTWLINPSKKNHNLLLELGFLLTKALDGTGNSDETIKRIGALYMQAKSLDLKDSTAKSLVEQFLLDGRFAVYQGASNADYQKTYESIARMIGIERTDAKSQLFQTLADIYSKNLFTQKNVETRISINTFSPTALELSKTFDKEEIVAKDYFDIAIYAYNILRKMEDKNQLLVEAAMEDQATYSYFMTFFRASNRYIESIDNIEKKQQTIMSFSRQFYDYMLSMIVNSLYRSVVITEDGGLYLNPKYREGVRVTMSDELIQDIQNLNATIKSISPSIEALWSGSGETDTVIFSRIKDNIVRLDALSTLIEPDEYKDYIKTPFKLSDKKSEGGFFFPLLDQDTRKPIRMDSAVVETINNNKALATDPRIKEIKTVWPDADASSLSIDGEDIRITKVSYKIGRKNNETSEIYISTLYNDKDFSDITLFYKDYPISVVLDPSKPKMSIQAFKAFLLQIDSYLDFIDSEIIDKGLTIEEIRIFPLKQRINIGDSLYPVVVSER